MKSIDVPEIEGGHQARLDNIVGRCQSCGLILAAMKLPATPADIRRFGANMAARGCSFEHARSESVRQEWGHADWCPRKPVTPPTQRELFEKGGE